MNPAAPGLLRVGANAINFGAYQDSPTTHFAYQGANWAGCALKQHQCAAQTTAGNNCSRMVTAGLPYCWQHLQVISHLAISPTTLTIANVRQTFLGLFAYDPRAAPNAVVFPQHAFIANMFGKYMTAHATNARYPGQEVAPYGVNAGLNGVQREATIELACARPAGGYANDCRPAHNRSLGVRGNLACQANAVVITYAAYRAAAGLPAVPRAERYYPILAATRNILNREEIFIAYGEAEYWGAGAIHQPNQTTSNGRTFGVTRRARF